MAEIKKGDIVVNYNREWIGVFEKWRSTDATCFWSWSLHNHEVMQEDLKEFFSSALPATKEEKEKFKKALLQKGYSYCNGKVIEEL